MAANKGCHYMGKGACQIMRHLVLGSAGQIGAPLCEFIEKQGDEVLTFDIVDDPGQDLRIYNNGFLKREINISTGGSSPGACNKDG